MPTPNSLWADGEALAAQKRQTLCRRTIPTYRQTYYRTFSRPRTRVRLQLKTDFRELLRTSRLVPNSVSGDSPASGIRHEGSKHEMPGQSSHHRVPDGRSKKHLSNWSFKCSEARSSVRLRTARGRIRAQFGGFMGRSVAQFQDAAHLVQQILRPRRRKRRIANR